MQNRSNIIVLGGHRLSTTYIRHLLKAKANGLIHFDQLSFIDPHTDPCALKEIREPLHFINQTYTQGLQQIFESTAIDDLAQMCVIPDHTAPHVLFQLFIDWLKAKNIETKIIPFVQDLNLPFQKTLDSGICAISYATWICPLECEEPDTCPAINNKRHWDFAKFLKEIKFEGLGHLSLFGCNQLAYGVCEIPLLLIRDEFQKLTQSLKPGDTFLVGTHSKCHGILGVGQIYKH
ncbi:MAG: hypothetical protein ACD_73C00778G0002 [uncultured bacterium]|nr:MAG: hypothetical protein ACD_73C00778G0002 [uncultured bacterium]